MSKFLIKIGDSTDLEHVPGSPEQTLGNQFQSVCRCGFKAKTAGTPSTAYQSCQAHADEANSAPEEPPDGLRSAPGSQTGAPAPYRPSRPEKARRTAGEKPSPRPCSCECGGMTGGGLFQPGHDAKLLSKLATAVRDRTITVPDAFAKLASMPKLHAKFASRVQKM